MNRSLSLAILFCIAASFFAGCIEGIDPLTGEKTQYLDPNHPAVPLAEGGAEVAVGLLPFLGPLGGAGAAALAAGLAYWKKLKPELTQERTAAQQGHMAGTALVDALTEYKKAHPQEWETLGTLIQKNLDRLGTDSKAAENFIRALRGLSPKV